jgi:hypothetical protein
MSLQPFIPTPKFEEYKERLNDFRRLTPARDRPCSCLAGAQSLGDWTLVGCTVAPGFEFAAFELAPKGWEPR